MFKLFIIVFLSATCSVFSQTQLEMNRNANEEFVISDKKLNEVYQAILVEYKTDTVFINSLKKTQRIWINFRDAELEMKFPNYKKSHYGSSFPMCRSLYLKKLTDERIKKLKLWLIGIEEGDMCSGSTKTK